MIEGVLYLVDYLDHCSYNDISKAAPTINRLPGYYVRTDVVYDKEYYVFAHDKDNGSGDPLHPYTSVLVSTVMRIGELALPEGF